MFDFCEHDLAGLLSNVLVKFTLSEIKRVMQMLLNGLYYIHRNKVRPGAGTDWGFFVLHCLWVGLRDTVRPDRALMRPPCRSCTGT